jgi:hypothetical protein
VLLRALKLASYEPYAVFTLASKAAKAALLSSLLTYSYFPCSLSNASHSTPRALHNSSVADRNFVLLLSEPSTALLADK